MPTASESRAAAASARLTVLGEQLAGGPDRVSVGDPLEGLGRSALGLGLMVPALC